MQELPLLKILQQLSLKVVKVKPDQRSLSKSNAGFTLIEVMFVMFVMGILAAIAAPSWISFTNRQRVNAANDAVLSALQDAQRQAKRNKLRYNVSFISVQDQVPKVAVYPAAELVPTLIDDPRWTKLGEYIALQKGQVLLYSNIDPANNPANNPANQNRKVAAITLATNARTLTFNETGSLPLGGNTTSFPLKVVVAQAKPGNSPPSNVMKRCVIVETLLGGMRTAKGTDNQGQACDD